MRICRLGIYMLIGDMIGDYIAWSAELTSHTLRIFVLNSKKVYMTPYSHQSSLMMYVFENYGYNFYSIMAFWENATFVFWLCQNSWFWVWKKNFSITIFHEKKLPFSVAPFILHLKHWNRAFEAFFVATKVHSATVPK